MSDQERFMRKLPPEQLDFKAIFDRISKTEKRRHRSVKLIQVLTGGEPEDRTQLLAFAGFPEAKRLTWNSEDADNYTIGEEVKSGGFVMPAQLSGEAKVSTFVFLKRNLSEPLNDTEYCTLIGILMHEMGHVDDIEEGRNLRFDRSVDMVAAEVYAYRYAFKRLMRENLRYPLSLLLANIMGDARFEKDGSVSRIVAERLVGMGEFRQYRQFIGDLIDVESLVRDDPASLPQDHDSVDKS